MRHFLIFCFALALSCSDSPTQVVVLIDAEASLRTGDRAIDNVRLDVFAIEGEGDSAEYTSVGSVAASVSTWPMRHVVTPAGGDSSRRYLVRVNGRRGFTMMSQASVASGYLDGETGYVSVVLPGGRCSIESCPLGETCVVSDGNARCSQVMSVEPSPNPPPMDAGTDADADVEPNECDESSHVEADCALEGNPPCAQGKTRCISGEQVCTPIYRVGQECGDASEVGQTCTPRICEEGNLECPSTTSPEAVEGQQRGCSPNSYCFGGSCNTCQNGASCNVNNGCREGVWNCSGPTPVCGDPSADGTRCGSSSPCDASVCQAGECQERFAFQTGNDPIECRATSGFCDVAEFCHATSTVCPADVFQLAGVVCDEQSEGDCFSNGVCNGTSAICSQPEALDEGVICGPEPGPCEFSNQCSGGTNEGVCGPAGDISDLNGLPCNENGTCSDGVCVSEEQCRAGERCRLPNTEGECAVGSCDGMGTCVADNERSCSLGSGQCSSGTCNNGACVLNQEVTCSIPPMDGRDPQCLSGTCSAAQMCAPNTEACASDCYIGATCQQGFCTGASAGGNPCANGGMTCNPRGTCEVSAHVVMSRVWEVRNGQQISLFVELYNPTQVEKGFTLTLESNGFGETEFSGRLQPNAFVTTEFENSSFGLLRLSEGEEILDRLAYNDDLRDALPIERKACIDSTPESMLEGGIHHGRGNGYNPPGENDYPGAWVSHDQANFGPSGTESYREEPNCRVI